MFIIIARQVQKEEKMNVYVYETYNDSTVFDDRTVSVFLNKSEAFKALKQSVEKFFDKDWSQIKDEEIGPNDWFEPDHVSYSPDGEIVYYWEITPFYTSESRYCTEDEIANEIDVMSDMFPEWNNIPESAYTEIVKNVLG